MLTVLMQYLSVNIAHSWFCSMGDILLVILPHHLVVLITVNVLRPHSDLAFKDIPIGLVFNLLLQKKTSF